MKWTGKYISIVICIFSVVLMPIWGTAACLAGGLMTLLTGYLVVGAFFVPLFALPLSFMLVGDWACALMGVALLLTIIIYRKNIVALFKGLEPRNIGRRKGTCRRDRKGSVLKTILAALVAVCMVYLIFIELLIQAVLVMDFMERLEAFDRITQQSNSDMVQTDLIKENHAALKSVAWDWEDQVDKDYWYTETSEGYKLESEIILQPETSHDWVFLVHGYTGSRKEMYIYAYWYYNQGYNVVLPDLRDQGNSQGDYIGMGLKDSQDCMAWLDMILDYDSQAQIVLHGHSMGGATVLMMTGREDLPSAVVACVADCSYTTAYDMFLAKAYSWLGLPEFPFVDSFRYLFMIQPGGYDLKKASALDAVAQSSVPTLFIHGSEDKLVSCDMVYELYDAATCPKELYVVEGAGHTQSVDQDPDAYYEKVLDFICQYIK